MLASAVARHKAIFFPKNAAAVRIDYEGAVSGDLQLVPAGAARDARDALADDYAAMLADGMLFDDGEAFEVLMDRCANIEAKANNMGSR